MSFSDDEYYELTTPQKINQKKGRMEEQALGINHVKSNMAEYALGILTNKSTISGFIPQDRHSLEHFIDADGKYSQAIVKKPRKY